MAHNQDWFHTWFGRDYLMVYAHRSEAEAKAQVDFLLSVIATQHGHLPTLRVLDMACGSGRHLTFLRERIPLSVGADLSSALLLESAARYPDLRGCLARYDMRQFCFAPKSFNVILNLFTSIGYFASDAETQAVFAQIAEALLPGGIFMLDYLNPEAALANLVPKSEECHGSTTITQHREYDSDTRRINKIIVINDGNTERTYKESVRVFARSELEQLFEHAALDVISVFGDLSGCPYHPSAPRLMYVTRKRSGS